MSEPETVTIKEWYSTGNISIRTDALGPDHPMHPYNQLLAQGVVPEHYGVENPYSERFDGKTRGELIDRIIQLENEILEMERWR